MKKTILLTLAGLLVVILLIAVSRCHRRCTIPGALISMGKNFVEPPIAISSFEVKSEQWERTLSTIGSLEAAKGLSITAELSGRVDKILFEAGSQVKAGDLLIKQDVSTEMAQLRSAQANAALAEKTLERTTELYNKSIASKSEYDNAQSTYRSAIANVDNIQATIDKKHIRAPFAGQLGIRLVNLGQSINAGEPVVSLQATDSMFANFSLPQQSLADIKANLAVRLTSDAVPNKTFTGYINAIDSKIEASTRSITIQAVLANPKQELLPGMFASIEVVLPESKSALLVPITAVQYATYGDSVFVIENKTEESETDSEQAKPDENKPLVVRQQFIKLGEARGDFVSVEKGLNTGQLVASAGVFKLRNGAPVMINNDAVPDFNTSPQVENK